MCDFSDNLIRDERLPAASASRAEAVREPAFAAFDEEELAGCEKRLGFYSDLQSLNSEDAITWSYFGSFLAETPAAARRLPNWLLEEVGLGEPAGSERCGDRLWRRTRTPTDRPRRAARSSTSSSTATGRRLLRGEVAFEGSDEPGSTGRSAASAQARLPRRDRSARLRRPGLRRLAGSSLDEPYSAVEPPDAHGVHTASVTWDRLAGYDRHPAGEEFSRYLAWKRAFLDD